MCKTPFLGSRLLIHHFSPLANLPSKTSLPLTDSGTSESQELLGATGPLKLNFFIIAFQTKPTQRPWGKSLLTTLALF